jgi:epoxyqueuosine reductase
VALDGAKSLSGQHQHRERLLLHVCCGPCSTHPIEVIKTLYAPTLFWSNSNISPLDEYRARIESGKIVANHHRLDFVEDPYDHPAWLKAIAGEESAPERGPRCAKCFAFSFGRAAAFAKNNGFPAFTTTLTISPHKDAETIFKIGHQVAQQNNLEFVAIDFKNDGGFQRSIELSKNLNLYRQRYCGCEFSLRHGSTKRPPNR